MGILLGLTAAFSWGAADFLARYATRLVGTYRTLFGMQFVGLAGLTVYLFWNGELARSIATGGWQAWLWTLLAGLLGMVGTLALYRSFEIGIISIVSPISASYAALTVVLAVLSGEALGRAQGWGIAAALLGVILAATALSPDVEKELEASRASRRGRFWLPPGVGWALGAALIFGIAFWVLGFRVTPRLGGVVPVWFIRLLTICLLPILALPLRQSVRLPGGKVWWLLTLVGILDTLGFVAATVGLATSQVAIVSVVSSLFSAITVLLAWLFLRERLRWNQWLGVVIIFVGIVLINV